MYKMERYINIYEYNCYLPNSVLWCIIVTYSILLRTLIYKFSEPEKVITGSLANQLSTQSKLPNFPDRYLRHLVINVLTI